MNIVIKSSIPFIESMQHKKWALNVTFIESYITHITRQNIGKGEQQAQCPTVLHAKKVGFYGSASN